MWRNVTLMEKSLNSLLQGQIYLCRLKENPCMHRCGWSAWVTLRAPASHRRPRRWEGRSCNAIGLEYALFTYQHSRQRSATRRSPPWFSGCGGGPTASPHRGARLCRGSSGYAARACMLPRPRPHCAARRATWSPLLGPHGRGSHLCDLHWVFVENVTVLLKQRPTSQRLPLSSVPVQVPSLTRGKAGAILGWV